MPFAGKALILQARLIGTYDSTGLFEVKIYDRTPAGEELSSREQVLTDLLYFSRYLFCMDLSQMTIRSIRYTNRHALQGSAVPIRSENGRYASILPDIWTRGAMMPSSAPRPCNGAWSRRSPGF